MTVAEFIVKLGFNADTMKVKEFVSSLGELPIQAVAGIASLAEIETHLVKIAEESMNAAVGFQMFSSQTGLSWQELQRWQIVAKQANVSTESVASSINALQRNMAEIRLGRGNIAPFQLLGIGVNQNAFQVLDQLRTRIKGLDRATATNLITQMGLTPDMIQVLSLTDAEFARLSTTISGMSGSQEGSFLKLKQQLVQVGLVFQQFGMNIVARIVDDLEMMYDKIRKIQVWMPGLAIAVIALTAAFAPMTAGFIALMLVLDDLAVYFQGGDSVIGLAIDGIKKLGDQIEKSLPAATWSKLGKLATFGGFLVNPIGSIASAAASVAPKVINQANNIYVHSTASAHEVGKAVKAEIDKGISAADMQTDNQGY